MFLTYIGLIACTSVYGQIPDDSHLVSAALRMVEAKHARPSKSRLNEHLISFDAAQFPEGIVCLVHEQADGSFKRVVCNGPVGTEDVIFYVPYPGDKYFLAGENWRSQNNLSEACKLNNAISPEDLVHQETVSDEFSASAAGSDEFSASADKIDEVSVSEEVTDEASDDVTEPEVLASAEPVKEESAEKSELSDVVEIEHSVSLEIPIESLTERQMMDQDCCQPQLVEFSMLCIIQRTSPVQRIFGGLFTFLLWVLIGYSCFRCCFDSEEQQDVLVIRSSDVGCPSMNHPDTHRLTEIHIVEQPAHVPVEQAFFEQPCDTRQSRSPTPKVTIQEEPTFNEAAEKTL